MSRPAEGRPQGPGLDNGVAETSLAILEEEPRQGLLDAQVLAGESGQTLQAATRASDGGAERLWRRLALRIEQGPDVLGGLTVLARDGIGVVAGHVDRRPPEAGLLLALGNHGIERGGLEVPERMQVEILRAAWRRHGPC